MTTECLVCNTNAVEEVAGFSSLPRVTSDCRPYGAGGRLGICAACGTVQKFPEPRWFEDTRQIYSNYFAYHMASGDEQLVLDQETGGLIRRSELILRRLKKNVGVPGQGRALDVGSGTGVMLRALSLELPGWQLHGSDLDARQIDRMRKIPGFEDLFTCPLAEIPKQFELVTMSHSLEHFPSPAAALRDLKSKIAPEGRVLVEVVDCRQNPFDVLVADHMLHFELATLGHLTERSGYRLISLRDDWVLKELSMVAAPLRDEIRVEPISASAAKAARARVLQQLKWLEDMVASARDSARRSKRFAIFGTSIASTWLTGLLEDRIDLYVDEDPSRVGQTFMGKPVFHPRDVTAGTTVFVALTPALAIRVAERMKQYEFDAVPPPQAATAS